MKSPLVDFLAEKSLINKDFYGTFLRGLLDMFEVPFGCFLGIGSKTIKKTSLKGARILWRAFPVARTLLK